jgi:hypothetical protein
MQNNVVVVKSGGIQVSLAVGADTDAAALAAAEDALRRHAPDDAAACRASLVQASLLDGGPFALGSRRQSHQSAAGAAVMATMMTWPALVTRGSTAGAWMPS